VSSEIGTLRGIIAKAYDRIRPGNALMYYPEANVLVPRHVDRQSRTPAFKNVAVRVAPTALAAGPTAAAASYAGVFSPNGPQQSPSTRDSMRAC
jgi:hypothetical protein